MTKRLLFVGLNTVDLQFLVNQYPLANTKTKAHQNEIFVGGPATNAAITCAYLGSEVDLYTPIGKHTLAAFIREDLARYNIHVLDPIAHSDGKPVFASIITSQHNGERTVFSYHPESKEEIIHDLNFNIQDYSLVMFDGFHPELALELARQAREHAIPTVLDGGSWKPGLAELLDHIDIAICSNDFKVPNGNTAKEIFQFLSQKGVKHAAITRGEKSILCSESTGQCEVPVEKVPVIDTLGAGDVFHGAFCHFYRIKPDFMYALREASKIAGRSCACFGTREWMK